MTVSNLPLSPSPPVGEGRSEGKLIQKSFAKKLRSNQTKVEKILWTKLRNRQVYRIKFRRQQPIGPYIVDFVTFEEKIIIELDGGYHNKESNRRNDYERTKWLEQQGYTVLRFWNKDIIKDPGGVFYAIHKAIKHPHSSSLPSMERENEV